MYRAPASVLTMLREFQKHDDKNFGGETIRIVKHDRIDAHGKEVSGCFVWLDVVAAVLPGKVMAVNKDMAPSLGYLDDGHGHSSELNTVFTKYLQMESGHVVSNHAPVKCVQGWVGGVAGAVNATGSGSSIMLPKDCFVVPSKNFSMYGKKMKHIHLGGFSVEMNSVGDRVIRFRKRDHKTAVADVTVAMGRYGKVGDAQEMILKMFQRKDDKVKDLESLEIDMDLLENKVCIFVVNQKF